MSNKNEKHMPTTEEFGIIASLCREALNARLQFGLGDQTTEKEKFVAALVAGNARWTIKWSPELLARFGYGPETDV